MIVVDASALVALGEREAEALAIATALQDNASAIISPINAMEAGLILIGRGRFADPDEYNGWLAQIGVTLDGDTIDHMDALRAYLRFGRGYHPAKLNLGDAFAYALAKRLDAPLLYKGDDFVQTDIRSALQPT